MRFKEVGGDKKNFCRDFHLSVEVPDSTVLFFDCLWSKAEYEKKSFGFEYEQRSSLGSYSHRSYVFVVPSGDHISPTETELKNWELFMYVDISEIPKLTLRWPLAPLLFKDEPFNITAYNVSIYRRGPPPDDEEEEEEELLNTAIVSALDAVGGELSYTFLTDVSETYWFTLRMIHEACGLQDCNVSKSHKIIINPQSQAKSLPVVFINYVPSHDAHVAFMVELTKYLRSHCADPHNWCIGEFERVDFVMVVSSPSTNQFVGIYKGVDQISLKLLKEKFGNSKSGLRYFSVQLPYCSEQDIPYEASCLVPRRSRCVKRFHLMQDLDNMLRYIHNRGGGPLCSCMGPNIPGGRAELEVNGRSLLQALDAAKAKIAKIPRSDDGADISSYLIPDPDSPNMSQPKSSATTEGGTDSQEPLMSMEERQEPWRYDPPLRIDTSEFWNHPAARRDSSKKTPRGTIPIHHIAK
ncbi:unnamed protein product, partial [Timema podura]|nr:unnamed protein product [Timema podura]